MFSVLKSTLFGVRIVGLIWYFNSVKLSKDRTAEMHLRHSSVRKLGSALHDFGILEVCPLVSCHSFPEQHCNGRNAVSLRVGLTGEIKINILINRVTWNCWVLYKKNYFSYPWSISMGRNPPVRCVGTKITFCNYVSKQDIYGPTPAWSNFSPNY